MKNEKKVLWIMIVGILFIAITPYLFTHLGTGIDFTSANSNNIGGTIGGITAPFTGLLGSLLVYYALLEQVKANKLIQKQLDEQKANDEESKVINYLKQQLEIIKNDIEDFRYQDKITQDGIPKDINVRYGSSAINKWLHIYFNTIVHHNSDVLEQFYQLKQITNLINLIDDFVKSILSEKISEKDKTYLFACIKYLFNSKIKVHFDFLKKNKEKNLKKCDVCEEYHNGIPRELTETINSINSRLNS